MPCCSVYRCTSRSLESGRKLSKNITNCQYKIVEEDGIVQIEIETIHFHAFPKSEDLRAKWVTQIHRQKFKPTKWSRVCSIHFEKDCFVPGKQRKILKRNAFPTIFPTFPKHLQKRVKRRKIPFSERRLLQKEVVVPEVPEVPKEPPINNFIGEHNYHAEDPDMVRVCSAWDCVSQDQEAFRDPPYNIQFFKFPVQNVDLRKKWTVAIRSGRRDNFVPKSYSLICSLHFQESDFVPNDNLTPGENRSRVLKPCAVPTLFFVPNIKEEQLMQQPKEKDWKPKISSVERHSPRRLRKIFVDEEWDIDSNGKTVKTFSFFVLPFKFAKGVPLKPDFKFTNPPKIVNVPKRFSQIGILNPKVKNNPDSAEPKVLYLTKAPPPPFPHTMPTVPLKPAPKPLFVKPVSQSAIHFKPFLLQSARPKPMSVQEKKTVLVPSNPVNQKASDDDKALSGSSQCDSMDVSDCLNVEISEVISLADKQPSGHTVVKTIDLTESADSNADPVETGSADSNADPVGTVSNLSKLIQRHQKNLQQINKIDEGAVTAQVEGVVTAQVEGVTTGKPNSDIETSVVDSVDREQSDAKNDSAVVLNKSATESTLKDASFQLPQNKVSVIEVEKSKNSDKSQVIDTVVHADINGDQQSPIHSNKAVQIYSIPNIKQEFPEIEVIENPSPGLSKSKPTSSSIPKPLCRTKFNLVPTQPLSLKHRVDICMFSWCNASETALGYAGEYEDCHIFQTLKRKSPMSRCRDPWEFWSPKQRRIDLTSWNRKTKCHILQCKIAVEPLEVVVSRVNASFYKGQLEDTKALSKSLPKKTFFYEKPEIFDPTNPFPMKQIKVALEGNLPSKTNKDKSMSSFCPVQKMSLKKQLTLQEKKALKTFNSRNLREEWQKIQNKRLNSIIQYEHNYINQETYIDKEGQVVINDPRVEKLQEKVAKMKKLVRLKDQKIARMEKSTAKSIEKLMAQLDQAKRDAMAPFERSNMHPIVKDIFSCEMKNAAGSNPNFKRYTNSVKEFCLGLYKVSPKAYSFVDQFFTLPCKQKIRNFTLSPFAISELVPRPRPLTAKQKEKQRQYLEGGGDQPHGTMPLDLEMDDLMYDLDTTEFDELQQEAEMEQISDEDEYEKSILQNPPTFAIHAPSGNDVAASSTGNSITTNVVDYSRRVETTSNLTPSKRRSRKSKKRKAEEEEADTDDEQQNQQVEEQWIREQQRYDVKITQPQQCTATAQQNRATSTQQTYNLYANPQPGTSSSSNQPGASMPDVYLGNDSLKTFESYYF